MLAVATLCVLSWEELSSGRKHSGQCVCHRIRSALTAVMIKLKKIIDTVHTAGTLSVSMYRHFTQSSDGIPQVKHKDLKALFL